MINNREPIEVLCDYLEGIDVQVYRESIDEDENSIPDSYILLRSQITDNSSSFGDGESKVRCADCDIVLVTKGKSTNSNSLHNINLSKIKLMLKQKKVSYVFSNLGYQEQLLNTQATFSIKVNYYG